MRVHNYNGIEIVDGFKRFNGDLALTIFDIQKNDGKTNRKTANPPPG